MTTASPARRRRRRLVAALLLAASVAVAGCGLSAHDEPQIIAADNLPPGLIDPTTTTTTLPATQTTPVTVYLLRGAGESSRLVAVERPVADPLDVDQRIGAVLTAQPTPEEEDDGLSSAIPTGVQLLDTALDEQRRELVIDLSQDFFDIQSRELINAFAQIVYTAAELDGVRTIRFRLDGEDHAASDEAGATQTSVDTGDYQSLRPR